MNRRGFLKRCSLLPFVGSLATVAKAEESEPILREAGVDEIRVVPKEKWFTLHLKPSQENISGAKEWLKECEEKLNSELTDDSFVRAIIDWPQDMLSIIINGHKLTATEIMTRLENVNFPKEYIK